MLNLKIKFSLRRIIILLGALFFTACGGNHSGESMAMSSTMNSAALSSAMSSTVSSNASSSEVSSSSPATWATVSVSFPTAVSMTGDDSVMVYGSAASVGDNIGVLTVNGVAATTSDNFAHWKASIPLAVGYNTLQIDVEDVAHRQALNVAQILVRRYFEEDSTPPAQPELQQSFSYSGSGLVLDSSNHRLLWIDNKQHALVAVDVNTGVGSVLFSTISSVTNPTAITLDSANNRVFVTDSYPGRVIAIDLGNGNSSIVSAAGFPDGINAFSDEPQALVLDSPNNRLLVLDANSVIAVNIESGTRTLISGPSNSNQDSNFNEPRDIILDSANNRVLVANYDSGVFPAWEVYPLPRDGSVIAVDLTSGERVRVASDYYLTPTDLALDSANNRVLILESMIQNKVIDPLSYARLSAVSLSGVFSQSIFSDFGPGWYTYPGGKSVLYPYARPKGMVLDSKNNRLFILDAVNGVIVVELESMKKVYLCTPEPKDRNQRLS